MNERWYPHVTVAAIAVKDGKYLLVKEIIEGVSVINQPAGHVEKGETLEQAVTRETVEETGWSFEPIYISGIYQYVAPNGETYSRFTFFGELANYDAQAPLDSEIEQIIWMDRSDMSVHPGLRSQSVLRCVEDYENGQQYPLNTVRQIVERQS
ncbi:MAG: NUDIX domain-containing protein [Gammaproteobacteria bacterium]|nr:NUDIX domain-containing protein [Gammaproteobacteria bacterium]